MASTERSEIEETIAEKVKRLIQIKMKLMEAINTVGGSCDVTDSFDSYPDKILSAQGLTKLSTLNISENGTYYARN